MDVATVNALTGTWAGRMQGSGVLSGVGLWPLLAILAASADEPGRSELAEATGISADEGMGAAQEVLKTLGDAESVDAALGVWIHVAAQVNQEWQAALPPASVGRLSGEAAADKRDLDRWASERTHGLIESCPIEVHRDLMLVLATALVARTTWARKFSDEELTPRSGPWAGRRLAGLQRTSPDLDDVTVADTAAGRLTVTRVEGDNGLDVHLVLGEESRRPGDVLAAGLRVVGGEEDVRPGSQVLASGDERGAPGLSVVPAQRTNLSLTSVRFTVRSSHDLMQHAGLFGLETVRQGGRGHFSRIGSAPLCVDQARQSAMATFSSAGFEAAAVTAVGLRLVSMPMTRARGLQVTYDRPFGFVALHRATGLAVVAGWVDDPDRWSG